MFSQLIEIKNILQSFSFVMLPFFYILILSILCFALISKSDFFANLSFVQKSGFFTNIAKKLSITDFFLMVFIFTYCMFFAFTYNSATSNLLISLAIIITTLLITILLKVKIIKRFSFSHFFKVFFALAVFVLVSNMFSYPEAFSIEKPGNIDLLKICILGIITVLSGFIFATSTAYYFAVKRGFKIKTKFKNRMFFNKILLIAMMSAFVLLMFTEADFANKFLFIFSLLLTLSMCKKFTEENWKIINDTSLVLLSTLLCASSIFIGSIFLTIVSSIICGLTLKELSTTKFQEFLTICKSSFLCKRGN
ncbi:MAG: hypothetical protein LBU68_00960 [Rickettsiales bacterium]|jgi:hypothetical protein|nr:hypothetical protein [Rickettsiales bacterium]